MQNPHSLTLNSFIGLKVIAAHVIACTAITFYLSADLLVI